MVETTLDMEPEDFNVMAWENDGTYMPQVPLVPTYRMGRIK